MEDPASSSQRGVFAAARAALRAEFRPRWWEFAITFVLVASAYPFVTRLFWLGKGATFEAVSYYVVICGLPAAAIVLNKFWRSPDARAKAAMRALLQVAIAIVMLGFLNFAGRMAYDASIKQNYRNGLTVLQEIRSFKEQYGRLPRSLLEIDRPEDDPLPTPTFGGEFGYEVQGEDFILRLKLPSGRTFIHDSRGPGGGSERRAE